MPNNDPKLTPHLHFPGDCEQALETYKTILNGSYDIIQRYTNPTTGAPEANKIMYAVFRFGDNSFFAGDSFGGHIENLKSGNIGMALNFTDPERARQVFDQFAAGAEILVPFEKQFWGAWHGTVIDRFGIRWMINCA